MKPLLLPLVSLFLASYLVFANEVQIPLLFDKAEPGCPSSSPKIAIIGAGAGGASTAYHLARLAGNIGQNVSITVYERSGYIGGRSTTVNVFDDARYPVELGACIFVPGNRILVQATRDFGLETNSLRVIHNDDDDDDDFGIWDGTQFVYTQSRNSNYYLNVIKLLRKYGLAPIKSRNLAKSAYKNFGKLYEEPIYPYTDLTNASMTLGLSQITSMVADEYLRKNGIGDQFAHDFIQAATRVNYAQNIDGIQALEALVSIFGNGAMHVVGGNWRIFDEMIIASGAKLHLNSPVFAIDKAVRDGRTVWDVLSNEGTETFDSVVLASPYHMSNISMNPLPVIPPVTYMTLHVTLVATKAVYNPGYFNFNGSVPATILTTLPNNTVDIPIFNSLSRALLLPTGESVYKIFSPNKITNEILEELFIGAPIDWVCRKPWQAYPRLDPIETFAPLELYPDLEGAGVWYTSGIESFISTMETSALSGRNVAALIARRLWK